MKKLIGYPLAWALYYLGDLISRIPNFNYTVYKNLMIWSSDVQEWSGLKSPWKKVSEGGTIER